MTDLWAGEFGDAYTARNRVDWRARLPFWQSVLDLTGARSVVEFGCNAGWNLRAVREADPTVETLGLDVNDSALFEARAAGLKVAKRSIIAPAGPPPSDLAFTAGVLIHIPPPSLSTAMRAVAAASREWVLAVEYEADTEEMVPYRGYDDALWRRPFGKFYEDLGLTLVSILPAPGFDNCTAWLLRRD